MKAAIYARVSVSQDDRDADAGSVHQQLIACRALARTQGLEIVKEHTEEISATSGAARPAFDELCNTVRSGQVQRVVCWSTERIVRRMSDLETYVTACEPFQVTTITEVAGPIDLSTPTGLMVARITTAVASFEVDQLRGRVKRGRRSRAERGMPVGGRIPFGFLDDRITHHPVEAVAIQSATRALLSGDSLRSIAHGWNDAGLTTRTGKRWSPSQVRYVLIRARNAGLVQHAGKIVATAVWEPLVTYDEWNSVCALIRSPERRTSPGPAPRWLLSFIARCECGEYMRTWRSGYDRHGNTRVSYRCDVRERTEPHATVPAEITDAHVTEKLIIGYWEQGFGFPTPGAPTPVVAEAPESRIADLQKRRAEVAQLWDDEVITTDEYRERLAKLDLRISQVPVTPSKPTAPPAPDTLESLRAEWEGFSVDRKRWIVKQTVDITMYRSGPGRRVPLDERVQLAWKFDTFQV